MTAPPTPLVPLRWSVVIPTFNYAEYLPRAIDSVLAQTRQPMEIIVADDGSTDGTRDVINRYGELVAYRRFPHRGVYALRQAMLAEIQGDWFVNLDADNRLAPDFLEQMDAVVRRNEADSSFAFAYPDMELFGESAGHVERPAFDVQRLKTGNYVDMNSAIRTEVARKYGFDPSFNSGQGDYDFFLTLVENGYRGLRVPAAVLHYRVHSDSLSRTASRRLRQRQIMRRMVRKHRKFFSPAERRTALAEAENRLLVALIAARSPFAGFGRRLAEWAWFAQAGWRHGEFLRQTEYCLCPRRYFSRGAAAAVFYLFRDTAERRAMVGRVAAGGTGGLARGQLFGFDELRKKGLAVDCNLRLPRTGSVRETVAGWIEKAYAPRTGIGLGDVCSVRAHLGQMNRARVVVATTDNTGLPAVRLKARGLLRAPLVYVSVGLPERLMAASKNSPARAARYRKRLAGADRFLAYGYAEAEWLREWLGDPEKVRFIPFGVDADTWRPEECAKETLDVLSVGSDPKRDFGLLLEYARQHPGVGVCLVVGKDCAAGLGLLPPNVEVRVQIPVEEVKKAIAGARVVVLPVKENTYSGATTTLLQCLAMGKAVAVSRVGAIRNGYGFEDGVNLRWMEPGSQESLDAAIDGLLADEEARHRIGAAARRHVLENLGWDRYVAEMESCLADWLEEEKK